VDVLEHAGEVDGGEVAVQLVGRLLRLDEPTGGAHGEDLHEREAPPLELRLDTRRMSLRVRATAPAVFTAPRATNAAPSSWASRLLMRIGWPWASAPRPSSVFFVRWPSTVVALMCPPVSPNTPLFSMKQVTFSPRAAVWSTSWRPSFTMSPSPWTVNTTVSGRARLAPVASDGTRPCSACSTSTSRLLENAV